MKVDRIVKTLALAAIACGMAVFGRAAEAGVPESGIYEVTGAPERGVVIEHQDGIVSVMLFAYNETSGEPEWYIASGRLRDDAVSSGIGAEPPLQIENYYPVHWFHGDLIKAKGGLCAVCYVPFRAPIYEKVGELALYVDFLNRTVIEVALFASETPVPHFVQPLRRMNVGYTRPPGEFTPVADLTGEWVFVDKTDPARQPNRYRFGPGEFRDRTGQLERPENSRPNSVYELTYRDLRSEAVLHCRKGLHRLPSRIEPMPPVDGCELRMGNEVIYAMSLSDVGLGRIQAFRGPLPLASGQALRGPLEIIAVRVE